jgi:hypothetical protein
MSTELKILAVKPPPGKTTDKAKRQLNPLLPGATSTGGFRPFLMTVVAPVRSGKTTFVVGLIYMIYKDIFEEIMYISPTIENDDTGWAVMQDEEIIKITENLTEIDLILESIVEIQKAKPKDKRQHTLIVLDDMLGLLKNQGQSYFASLCSKYRHWKISIIVSVQSYRSLPPICRANSTAYIIFKTHNDKEHEKMVDEFSGNFPFDEVYEYATEERYNFLYLNLEQVKAYKNFEELIYEKYDK